jgi:hypothetical protein
MSFWPWSRKKEADKYKIIPLVIDFCLSSELFQELDKVRTRSALGYQRLDCLAAC